MFETNLIFPLQNAKNSKFALVEKHEFNHTITLFYPIFSSDLEAIHTPGQN